MTDIKSSVKTLIQGMLEDRKHYAQLVTLLEQQRQFIITRHTENLEAVNKKLIEHYMALAESSQQRYYHLSALGIPVGVKGLRLLFARLSFPDQVRLNNLWDELEQQALQCKVANEANGMLLNMQKNILQDLLDSSNPKGWLYEQN